MCGNLAPLVRSQASLLCYKAVLKRKSLALALAGVLTETTAEMGVSLTFAAARRIVEGDSFMRAELYKGWLPDLFIGNLLQRKTIGIIGAGRIGTAYARMMSEGHKMNVLYYDPYPAAFLENYIKASVCAREGGREAKG